MADLFDHTSKDNQTHNAQRPLADRIRPRTLDEVIGQQQVVGQGGPLRTMLDAGNLSSLIFWGPPGVGKTTLARLLADEVDLHFVQISAIFSGVADLKKVFESARLRGQNGRGTLLFVDEIHRFNKAQQDGFLPFMEDGTIVLVGATTENPSFELNAALMSRAQVMISALHKSVRGSDPDAALYWFARMLKGGEDPRYLARRITRMAVEDIGLADPQAQNLCLQAWQTYERLGSPEGELALSQAVVYLALAPKSNASYVAYKAAMKAADKTGSKPPPKHILNAPTAMMKDIGYGDGYDYDHDAEDGFSGQNYFPDEMARGIYYLPVDRGAEREMKKRIDYFAKLRAKRGKG
ncbi:UNVERIFIED_CONTAM: hypothetical protein GTU68_017919 [Idotea baltica]|nr:hypothetical protein [Idotea baltica]